MPLCRIIIHTFFYGLYYFHKITRTGAFGRSEAEYVSEPIQTAGNSLKAALLKHHVKQYHEASCSVATVASVVNAISEKQTGMDAPVSQMDILEKVRTGNWKERMSPMGDNGKRGLPLPLLGEIVKGSLDAYGIRYERMEVIGAPENRLQKEKVTAALKNRLSDFETKGDCIIIAHFDQGAFLRTLNIPHISPVGGFDISNGDVVILDVDPEQKKPYKISFDTFCKGIFSNYHNLLRPFGFKSGGYIYIKLMTS
ncbi:MAG: phytochelatin synthase family protein [Desulfobacterales bacterium]|nr:phytochelatin synthase family protein [Desulfobacterales bacterium]